IEPLPERNDIRFLAGWTGTPASTKEFVNKTRHGGVSDVVEGFTCASARIVELLAAALRDDDPETARSASDKIGRCWSLSLPVGELS
ncbi:MAG: hypothetical protein U0K19_00255, partial [Bifidobacteriaceae bacterium]|nr:hypothetical protein [Bifidobacteriaceae bacterium]